MKTPGHTPPDLGAFLSPPAPYVASQLIYAFEHRSQITPVLLGFSPLGFARNVAIEGYGRTFRSITDQIQKDRAERPGLIHAGLYASLLMWE